MGSTTKITKITKKHSIHSGCMLFLWDRSDLLYS
jgi:hypothetical protein